MILRLIFKGRVQGVGFRYRAKAIADKLKLAGSVKNLYDGNVEVYLSGDSNKVDQFINEISMQSFIRVDDIERKSVDKDMASNDFEIIY